MNTRSQASSALVAVQDMEPIFKSDEVRQIHSYLVKQHGAQAMSDESTFRVTIPGPPQAWQRPRFAGRSKRVYSPPKLEQWYDAAALAIWHGVFMVVVTLIMVRGLAAGLEKAVKYLMPALFFLLPVMVGYGILRGDMAAALHFMFDFDLSAISGKTTEPRWLMSFTSVPSSTPTRGRSREWTRAPASIASLASDGDIAVPTARSYSLRLTTNR